MPKQTSSQQASTTTSIGEQPKNMGGAGLGGISDRMPLICRLVTLAFGIICIGLIIDPINAGMQPNINRAAMSYVTFAAFIIINCVLIIGELTDNAIPKIPSLIFVFLGAVMYLVAGAVIIDDWRSNNGGNINLFGYRSQKPKMYMDMIITSGIFALLAFVGYVVDFAFSFKQSNLLRRWGNGKPENGQEKQGEEKRISTISTDQTDLSDFAV